jgi:hypothetical protein
MLERLEREVTMGVWTMSELLAAFFPQLFAMIMVY